MNTIISCKDVTVSFRNQQVFHKLSIDIQENETILLKGKSGSGKSTVFQLLFGFVIPDSGEVQFEGTTINQKNIWEIRKSMRMIRQNVTLGHGKVQDIIHTYSQLAQPHKHPPTFNRMLCLSLMDYFELHQNIFDKDFAELSGGEKQRVAIVMANLINSKVFLLDEITASLNTQLKKKTVDFFHNKENTTLVCISHDREWITPSTKIYNVEQEAWES